MANGETLISFSGTAGMKLAGEISSDNQWLASVKIFSREVTVWNIGERKEVRNYSPLDSFPVAIKFSKDASHLAARSQKGEVVVWERESGKEIHRVKDAETDLEVLLEKLSAN